MPKLSLSTWLAGLIILVGCFLRIYHLTDTVLFLGDQGRDALIARRILIDHRPVLIGPVTSVGNMYLGPFYYYFMVPFLALTYPSPIGPVYGVALVNCISLIGLYLITKKWFNQPIALMSLAMYALMPVAINLSRFSWNPNLSAPVAVLLLYGLFDWTQSYSKKSFAIVLSSLAVMIQLHYVALITVALFGAMWIWSFIQGNTIIKRRLLHQLAITGLILAAALSPILIFDLRHDFIISNRFKEFLFTNNEHLRNSQQLIDAIREMEGRTINVIVQLITVTKTYWDKLLTYAFVSSSVYFLIVKRKTLYQLTPTKIVGLWIVLTVILTSFYTSTIFDHYIAFAIPALTIAWSLVLYHLYKHSFLGKILAGILATSLIYLTLPEFNAIRFTGNGFQKYQQTVDAALPFLNPPYNLALLSGDRDYRGMNYRYFFQTLSSPPESEELYTNLKQLVVIDEVGVSNPFDNPAHELQAPGLRQLTQKITLPDGPTLLFYSQSDN